MKQTRFKHFSKVHSPSASKVHPPWLPAKPLHFRRGTGRVYQFALDCRSTSSEEERFWPARLLQCPNSIGKIRCTFVHHFPQVCPLQRSLHHQQRPSDQWSHNLSKLGLSRSSWSLATTKRLPPFKLCYSAWICLPVKTQNFQERGWSRVNLPWGS